VLSGEFLFFTENQRFTRQIDSGEILAESGSTCSWRIHKSRGNRRLVQPATVLLPTGTTQSLSVILGNDFLRKVNDRIMSMEETLKSFPWCIAR